MKDLIMKDFRLLTIFNMITPLAWLALGLMVKTMGVTDFARAAFIGYSFFYMNLIPVQLTKSDEGSNIDIILNSLSIKRGKIVLSRYASILIYTIINIFGFYIAYGMTETVISRFLGHVHIGVFDLLFILGLSLIVLSFYLPSQYYNREKTQRKIQVFYLTLIFFPLVLLRFKDKFPKLDLAGLFFRSNYRQISMLLTVVGIALYIASFGLSYKLYKSKEF